MRTVSVATRDDLVEALPRLPRCSLPYPLGGMGHAFPALRPARAFASRIPLGRGPSLHGLRRRSHPLVRPIRRYYDLVRPLHSVHLRLRFSFPLRPRHDCRGRVKTSQVPVEGVHACLGSQTPRSSPRASPCHGADGVAFDGLERLGASDYLAFGAQYPCPHAPLPTLHPRPHGRRCTARGETWLATPFVSRDFHPLPFHQLAWHSKSARNLHRSISPFRRPRTCGRICFLR